MRLSIILPMFDRQHLGWASLASALRQDVDRGAYEVVSVSGPGWSPDNEARAMLEECDAVVQAAHDLSPLANRLDNYRAGAAQARGEILFFLEGHTILQPDCCRLLLAHFDAHPDSQVTWAPRINASHSASGRIADLLHEQSVKRANDGLFSVGGQSAIRRELFLTLSAAASRYGMFGESAVMGLLRERQIPVARLTAPLCRHYNDYGLDWWSGFFRQLGEAHFTFFETHWPGKPRTHRLLGLARGFAMPRLLEESLLRCGAAFRRLAAWVPDKRLAVFLWRQGGRLGLLSGFCGARRQGVTVPSSATA